MNETRYIVFKNCTDLENISYDIIAETELEDYIKDKLDEDIPPDYDITQDEEYSKISLLLSENILRLMPSMCNQDFFKLVLEKFPDQKFNLCESGWEAYTDLCVEN